MKQVDRSTRDAGLRDGFAAALKERQQIRVDLVFERGNHSVRRAGKRFQRSALDDLR